jgi:hypothetical protein
LKDNFEVKNEEIAGMLRDIGDRIHKAINNSDFAGKMGFALLIFEFGEKGALFYLSDAQRKDMIRVLEEFTERQRKEMN